MYFSQLSLSIVLKKVMLVCSVLRDVPPTCVILLCFPHIRLYFACCFISS